MEYHESSRLFNTIISLDIAVTRTTRVTILYHRLFNEHCSSFKPQQIEHLDDSVIKIFPEGRMFLLKNPVCTLFYGLLPPHFFPRPAIFLISFCS